VGRDGHALPAVRDAHCEVEAIATAIAETLAAGDGVEIGRMQYEAARPRPPGLPCRAS